MSLAVPQCPVYVLIAFSRGQRVKIERQEALQSIALRSVALLCRGARN